MKYTNEDAELIKEIISEEKSDNKNTINELRLQINDELHKPDDKMDIDLIDENIRTLFMLEGREYENHVDVEKELIKATQRAKAAQPWFKRFLQYKLMKPVLVACLSIVLLFSTNAIYAHATGNSFLDSVVQFGKNCIGFSFLNTENQSSYKEKMSPNNQLYQYLKQKCRKCNLVPLLPKSSPQDFEVIDFKEEDFNIRKVLTIRLGNKSNSFLLHIDYYFDQNDISEIKLPDTSDYEKVTIHGNEIYFTKKGNVHLAMFRDGNYVYNINSNLSYDETVNILNSMSH